MEGCTLYEKHRLELIQYEAAQLVSGLTGSVTINNIMNEIGWLSPSDKREYQKLVIMYKIQNGMAPNYLCNLLPPIVGQRTTCNLRNAVDISILNRRTEVFFKIFYTIRDVSLE